MATAYATSEAAADCVWRCQQALLEIDSNANLATLVPCWLDDLVQRVNPDAASR